MLKLLLIGLVLSYQRPEPWTFASVTEAHPNRPRCQTWGIRICTG